MRLGFYYHIPVIQRKNQILMPGYLGRFFDTLAEYFDSLLLFLHAPNSGENSQFDYTLKSKKISLIPLPPRRSVPYRMLHKQQITGIIKNHANDIDALFLRGPSPLLPPIANCMKELPTILLIVGDQLAGVNDLLQPCWRKEAIRAFWKWNNWQQLRIAKRSLTFVNSHLLYQELEGKVRNLVETRTTTLVESDFYIREDTCLDRPVRLLFTGRMDRTKGLLDILEALAILVMDGYNLVFDLVGPEERNDQIVSDITTRATKLGLGDRIFYHGYQPIGPALFAFYNHADIFITASQSSEGFPRTIWEAMAHSLPVVATRVGSIPDFIEGAAELVEPKNPHALAGAINRIIHNTSLRQEYISKGFSLVRQITLESQVGEMARVIQEWVEQQHS